MRSSDSSAVSMFDEGLSEITRRLASTDDLSLCLDFDGTLAPIVDDPDNAKIPDETRRELAALVSRSDIDIAVISGRNLIDVKSRVDLNGITFAGNHGLEIETNSKIWRHPIVSDRKDVFNRIRIQIEEQLEKVSGAFIEDKGATIAVHYRRADPEDSNLVRNIVTRETSKYETLHATNNDQVIDIRPDISWGKGEAVDVLTDSESSVIMYIGDDTTDVDAFRTLATNQKHIRVAVGQDRPYANFILDDPIAVRSVLSWINDQ